MKCPNCGNENRPGAKFCRFCGKTITIDELTPSSNIHTPELNQPNQEVAPQPEAIATEIAIPPPASEPAWDPYATLIVDQAELFGSPSAEQPIPVDPEEPESISEVVEALTTQPELEMIPTGEDHLEEYGDATPIPTAPAAKDIADAAPNRDEVNEGRDEPASDKPKDEVIPPGDANLTRNAILSLRAGTVLGDRYRIASLLIEEDGAYLYQAEDLRLCWNCGSEQTDPDPRFCEMCGMELTTHPIVTLRQTLRLPMDGPAIFHAGEYTYQVEPGAPLDHPIPPAPVAGYFAGYASDTGRQREIDEDSLLVLQLAGLCNRCSGPTLGFFAVADGIGGQDAGEIASRIAVHSLAETMMQQIFLPAISRSDSRLPTSDLETFLQENLVLAVRTANQAIIDLRKQSPTASNMGCTLTAVLLFDTLCVVANVGDSRTYRMHGSRLTQITRDHSIVANLVKAGEITAEEALTHDKKGVIYRCLGDLPELDVDTYLFELEIGDRLLLCCDGLWEMVPDGLTEDILLQYTDPQAACQRLVTLANEAGGEDNISVIVINAQSVT
jgi:serine/threonine protein phosphatase PrpC